MKHLPLIARILLGLVFFAGGITYFFITPPTEGMPPALMAFNDGLKASVYFMPFLKVVEALCGLMLLSGLYVPLALVVLAPIVINIFLVHAFLAPQNIVIAIVLVVLEGYLAFLSPYRERIRPLFQAR